MKEEFQNKLYSAYPTLFPALNRRGGTPFEQYGFCVGDGWYSLLNKLAEGLSLLDSNLVCHQVKEKFGSLRFYTNRSTKEVDDLILIAELESCKTCEDCGASGGKPESPRYWLRTVCPDCLITWNLKCEKL